MSNSPRRIAFEIERRSRERKMSLFQGYICLCKLENGKGKEEGVTSGFWQKSKSGSEPKDQWPRTGRGCRGNGLMIRSLHVASTTIRTDCESVSSVLLLLFNSARLSMNMYILYILLCKKVDPAVYATQDFACCIHMQRNV